MPLVNVGLAPNSFLLRAERKGIEVSVNIEIVFTFGLLELLDQRERDGEARISHATFTAQADAVIETSSGTA